MKKYNTHKIDCLLQYTLLTAGQEDWGGRELGMIHLIKYLYLADLAYSERHNGETYTGLNWKFYHFGPWVEELYQKIEPALLAIGAEKKIYPRTKYEKEKRKAFRYKNTFKRKIGQEKETSTVYPNTSKV